MSPLSSLLYCLPLLGASLFAYLRFRLYMRECRRLIERGEASKLPLLAEAARLYRWPTGERLKPTSRGSRASSSGRTGVVSPLRPPVDASGTDDDKGAAATA